MKRYRHEEDCQLLSSCEFPQMEVYRHLQAWKETAFQTDREELLFSQREVQGLFWGAWRFKLLWCLQFIFSKWIFELWHTNSSKVLIVVISAVHQVFPVLMLGKMVPPCPFEVMKGHTTCFGQTYMRSEVFHFPLKTLRVSSQSITFSFFPFCHNHQQWSRQQRLYQPELWSEGCAKQNCQLTCSDCAVQMRNKPFGFVLLPQHNPSSLLWLIQLWIQLVVKHWI